MLTLGKDTGTIYTYGRWATPIQDRMDKPHYQKSSTGDANEKLDNGIKSLGEEVVRLRGMYKQHIVDSIPPFFDLAGLRPKPKIVGSGFNQNAYDNNPMNQKMEVLTKQTRKQSIHNRIKF